MIGGAESLLALWWGWMRAMSVQVALLVVAVMVLDRLLAPFGFARLRSGLYLLVAIKLVLPPTLAAWWRAPTPPSDTALGGSTDALGGTLPTLLLWLLFAVWLLSVLAVGGRAVLAGRALRSRLVGASRPADERVAAAAAHAARLLGLACCPEVRVGGAQGPLAIGCRRPLVVLPAAAAAWRDDDLAHALTHELAHVKRRDLWQASAFAALSALYAFHPAVHLARGRAHVLRELCCDAALAARLGPGYRNSLLRLAAAALLDRPLGAVGVAAPLLGRQATTVERLEALARAPRRRPAQGLLLAAALVAIGCLALPMARPAAPEAATGDLASARALAQRMVAERRLDPASTGSLHVRWAVLQLNQSEARRAGNEEER